MRTVLYPARVEFACTERRRCPQGVHMIIFGHIPPNYQQSVGESLVFHPGSTPDQRTDALIEAKRRIARSLQASRKAT